MTGTIDAGELADEMRRQAAMLLAVAASLDTGATADQPRLAAASAALDVLDPILAELGRAMSAGDRHATASSRP